MESDRLFDPGKTPGTHVFVPDLDALMSRPQPIDLLVSAMDRGGIGDDPRWVFVSGRPAGEVWELLEPVIRRYLEEPGRAHGISSISAEYEGQLETWPEPQDVSLDGPPMGQKGAVCIYPRESPEGAGLPVANLYRLVQSQFGISTPGHLRLARLHDALCDDRTRGEPDLDLRLVVVRADDESGFIAQGYWFPATTPD